MKGYLVKAPNLKHIYIYIYVHERLEITVKCCNIGFCLFPMQMQKGNEVLKKAKAKSEQIEKKGDKVSVKSVNNSQCVMQL